MSDLVGAAYCESCSLAVLAVLPYGIVLLSIAASQTQNWRALSASISLSAMPVFLCFLFLVESPRWSKMQNMCCVELPEAVV